jgi:hypothetical protein
MRPALVSVVALLASLGAGCATVHVSVTTPRAALRCQERSMAGEIVQVVCPPGYFPHHP